MDGSRAEVLARGHATGTGARDRTRDRDDVVADGDAARRFAGGQRRARAGLARRRIAADRAIQPALPGPGGRRGRRERRERGGFARTKRGPRRRGRTSCARPRGGGLDRRHGIRRRVWAARSMAPVSWDRGSPSASAWPCAGDRCPRCPGTDYTASAGAGVEWWGRPPSSARRLGLGVRADLLLIRHQVFATTADGGTGSYAALRPGRRSRSTGRARPRARRRSRRPCQRELAFGSTRHRSRMPLAGVATIPPLAPAGQPDRFALPLLSSPLRRPMFFAARPPDRRRIGYCQMRMSLVGRNNLRLVPRDPGAAGPPRDAIMDDQALVAAAKAGNPAVASMLCDRLWPQVDRSIRRLVGASDIDRDDLSQLAMIELVGTIDRYRADCSLDSSTQAVTAHVVFKHLRRRRLERRVFSDLSIDDGAVGAPVHVERRSATREALARIAALLDEMNEGRAWTYVLHDLLGYDFARDRPDHQFDGRRDASRLVRGGVECTSASGRTARTLRGVDGSGGLAIRRDRYAELARRLFLRNRREASPRLPTDRRRLVGAVEQALRERSRRRARARWLTSGAAVVAAAAAALVLVPRLRPVAAAGAPSHPDRARVAVAGSSGGGRRRSCARCSAPPTKARRRAPRLDVSGGGSRPIVRGMALPGRRPPPGAGERGSSIGTARHRAHARTTCDCRRRRWATMRFALARRGAGARRQVAHGRALHHRDR